MSKSAGSGVTGDLLAHCIDTAIWLNGGIGTVTAMTETFIKERKHNLTGKVKRSALTMPARFWPGSTTVRWPRLNPPVTRAATRRFIPLKSTARTPPSPGTCTICIASNTLIIGTKASCAAGAPSTSPTATILT